MVDARDFIGDRGRLEWLELATAVIGGAVLRVFGVGIDIISAAADQLAGGIEAVTALVSSLAWAIPATVARELALAWTRTETLIDGFGVLGAIGATVFALAVVYVAAVTVREAIGDG